MGYYHAAVVLDDVLPLEIPSDLHLINLCNLMKAR